MSYEVETKLVAAAGENGSEFGSAVAISADKSTIVVGSWLWSGADFWRGRLYAFNGPNYSVETIIDTGADDEDFLGWNQVAVSADGSVIVAGAYATMGSVPGPGVAYVYSGVNWTTKTTLTASDGVDGDNFGYAVACSATGAIVAVSAYVHNGGRGAVYVYSGAGWLTETILTASDAAVGDFFGEEIALSDDGTILVVAAPETGAQRGRQYVYSGAAYATETKLTPAVPANNDAYGIYATAISGDGLVVAGETRVFAGGAGTVYVNSGALWSTQAALVAAGGVAGDRFGSAATLSQDASRLLVGAVGYAGGAFRGRAYVRSGVGYAAVQVLDASDGADGDSFGQRVALSSDGSVAVVTAPYAAGGNGAVYVYSPSATVATRQRTLTGVGT